MGNFDVGAPGVPDTSLIRYGDSTSPDFARNVQKAEKSATGVIRYPGLRSANGGYLVFLLLRGRRAFFYRKMDTFALNGLYTICYLVFYSWGARVRVSSRRPI